MPSLFKKILLFKICKAEINYKRLNPRNWPRPSFKKIIKGLAFLVIFLAALIILRDEYYYQTSYSSYDLEGEVSEDGEEEEDCNVLGIELHGDVVTYVAPYGEDDDGNTIVDEAASEEITYLIDQAEDDEDIKAIMLEVDSYGGMPVAAEEISEALRRAAKPTVALVRSAAVSAAYFAASGADTIFASALSDIGGIGVSMSYLDSAKKNEKEGLTYNSLSVGKFKDYGDPDKPLTAAEREVLTRDLNIIYNLFIEAVSRNRNLPIEKVRLLADGSSLPGQLALENGLIDRLGGMAEVEDYLKEKIGEDVSLCW